MVPFDHREQVLAATWTPQDGARVTFSDLPAPWLIALERLGRDLKVRRYGGDIERIDWVAEYDPEGGWVWLLSSVTIAGHRPSGLGVSGMGASVVDGEDQVLVSMADLVQNEVAEAGTAWPWGDAGGFMNPRLIDDVAVWVGRDGQMTRIGDLEEND